MHMFYLVVVIFVAAGPEINPGAACDVGSHR